MKNSNNPHHLSPIPVSNIPNPSLSPPDWRRRLTNRPQHRPLGSPTHHPVTTAGPIPVIINPFFITGYPDRIFPFWKNTVYVTPVFRSSIVPCPSKKLFTKTPDKM